MVAHLFHRKPGHFIIIEKSNIVVDYGGCLVRVINANVLSRDMEGMFISELIASIGLKPRLE